MKRGKSGKLLSIDDNYIFYACLLIVLAIAVFGIASDVVAGQ
jgi:hypothetical protein